MWGALRKLACDETGAVAPTVALSLFALIASGGIAFDYARLAAMDTELQDAADQAALAAATQLDRTEDATERATDSITAENDEDRLAANFTRFANDDDDARVEIEEIKFCKNFDDANPDTDAACDDDDVDGSNAVFVVVRTSTRTANYALTPIVAALSGSVRAEAVAGVEGSICNVAPLFVCTDDENFPTDADIGRGLLMKTGSGNSWAPGNYGLLDFTSEGGGGNTAVINALLGHGLNGCQSTSETTTEPGNKNVTDAINTRLDVYAGNPATNDPAVCNVADGTGCPALNARKDMIGKLADQKIDTTTNTQPSQAEAEAIAPACPADPKSAALQFEKPATPVVGFGRDTCHYSGTCADGNFGDKNWDRTAYFNLYHGGDASGALAHAGKTNVSDLTRYDVYQWELADSASRMVMKRVVSVDSTPKVTGGKNPNYEWKVRTQCNYAEPKYGRTDYPAQKDRRVLPVVAARCDALNGSGTVGEEFTLIRVFDVFITEPSLQRSYPGVSDDKEIYGEVLGPAEAFAGGGLQYYSRTRPYLVR